MTAREGRWTVIISQVAKADLKDIQRWTAMNFGAAQAIRYEETLQLAIEALKSGRGTVALTKREDLGHGVFSLHVARRGRRGRHVLILKLRKEQEWELLRVLHDSRDLARHIPRADE